MLITFGTQKGGPGKTTLAIALANYLSLFTDFKIKVYDLDFQRSLHKKWQEDISLGLNPLYEVIGHEEEKIYEIDEIKQLKDNEYLNIVDLAGTLDDKYSDFLIYSDIIITPFEYSDISLKATLVFVNLLGLMDSEAVRIFIRSRYDKGYGYKNQEEMDNELMAYGNLVNYPVYKRNCLQEINTCQLNYKQKAAVKEAFDKVLEIIHETIPVQWEK